MVTSQMKTHATTGSSSSRAGMAQAGAKQQLGAGQVVGVSLMGVVVVVRRRRRYAGGPLQSAKSPASCDKSMLLGRAGFCVSKVKWQVHLTRLKPRVIVRKRLWERRQDEVE